MTSSDIIFKGFFPKRPLESLADFLCWFCVHFTIDFLMIKSQPRRRNLHGGEISGVSQGISTWYPQHWPLKQQCVSPENFSAQSCCQIQSVMGQVTTQLPGYIVITFPLSQYRAVFVTDGTAQLF